MDCLKTNFKNLKESKFFSMIEKKKTPLKLMHGQCVAF